MNLTKPVVFKNIAKRLQQSETYDDVNDEEFVSQYASTEGKIVLKGTLKEKLAQLDKRETELLQEINHLNKKIRELKEERRPSRNSNRSHSGGSGRSSRSHSKSGRESSKSDKEQAVY